MSGAPELGAFDPDIERLLVAISMRRAPALEQLEPGAARQGYRESCAAFALDPAPGMRTEDRTTPDGSRLRIYRPVEGHAASPWLFYLHGGGWMLGDLDTHDPVCRELARRSGCCVIALHYPRAPEHRFPAALDSAVAALGWCREQAAALGVQPERMAIGGDSAGAGLAAAACVLLRDAGVPAPRLQLLFYPAVDLRADSSSYARVTSLVPLTAARMRWFIRNYLDDASAALDPRASPLLTPSLARLPPALLVSCGHDPLRDEGIEYAHRLEAAGVRVTHLHLADQIHGFLTMGRAVRRADTVLHLAAQELARL